MRKFHGSKVGSLAQHIYACQRCGTWQVNARGFLIKPEFECCNSGCFHTVFDHFPSKAEARTFASLRLRESAGEIDQIELQPRFPLHAVAPNGERVKIGTYVGDFRYRVVATGERRVVDSKGDADTHMSALKRKHAEVEHGMIITITKG